MIPRTVFKPYLLKLTRYREWAALLINVSSIDLILTSGKQIWFKLTANSIDIYITCTTNVGAYPWKSLVAQSILIQTMFCDYIF